MEFSESAQTIAKATVSITAILVLAATGARMRDRRGAMLLVLASVSAALYPLRFVASATEDMHPWEQFHYVLGAKYFPELGYDGLYEASYAVLASSAPQFAPRSFRDLRTNQVVLAESVADRARARLDAFSAPRRLEFENDVLVFVGRMTGGTRAEVFLDHGYNAPPTFTVVARSFLPSGPLTGDAAGTLASFDRMLMALLVLALGATLGRVGVALPVLVATASLTWNYEWTGGSFLRWDWIAGVVLGTLALSRGRLVLGASLFAYATSVRAFPAVFAFAAALPFFLDLGRDDARRRAVRYGTAYGVALAAFLALGCTAGHGLRSYSEFADRLTVHRSSWLANDVGLGTILVADRIAVANEHSVPQDASPLDRWAKVVGRTRAARAPIALAATLAIAWFLAHRLRGRSPHEGAVFGLVLLFTATSPANYYWVVCLLLPLAAPSPVVALVFATSLAVAALKTVGLGGSSSAAITGSIGLAVTFAAWLASLTLHPRPPAAIESVR